MNNIELSIVILSYNTKDLLHQCLLSLKKNVPNFGYEIIVVDNASTDGSVEMVQKEHPSVKLIKSETNLGFARGNNLAKKECNGKYILFLNSDTEVTKNAIEKTLEFVKNDNKIGAATCKVVLPNGRLDKDTRRSFPTPWVSLTHLVLKLDKIFPKSKLFAQYWYGYISENEIHQIDVIQGAFCLCPKNVLDKVGWFSEEYFLDGEDIDLSWKIKSAGYQIYYYPVEKIIHYKGASKGKSKIDGIKVNFWDKARFRLMGINSMEIFYKKFMWKKYPLILNWLVIIGINLVKIFRLVKLLLS